MIDRTQAVIEFSLEGEILRANDNFLATMGFTAEEVVGKHHSMFVPSQVVNSQAYRKFWTDLRNGGFFTDEFLRLGKNGRQIWIHATYAPVLGVDNTVVRVIKIASDITARKVAINAVTSGLKALARGDLQARVDPSLGGDFGQLAADFNDTMGRLASVFSTVVTVAQQISQASGQALSRAEETSNSVRQRAERFSDASLAIDEMGGMVSSTAEEAGTSIDQINSALEAAKKGAERMITAAREMEVLEKSARQMVDINQMIDNVAFQTNLLALNAGVEAARAGSAGAGFSVVAAEIRELARQSSESSKMIEQLISTSVKQANHTGKTVREGADMLDMILSSVAMAATAVEHIAADSSSQAKSVSRVQSIVGALNTAMSKDSQSAHLNAEAARQLKLLGEELTKRVDTFQQG